VFRSVKNVKGRRREQNCSFQLEYHTTKTITKQNSVFHPVQQPITRPATRASPHIHLLIFFPSYSSSSVPLLSPYLASNGHGSPTLLRMFMGPVSFTKAMSDEERTRMVPAKPRELCGGRMDRWVGGWGGKEGEMLKNKHECEEGGKWMGGGSR
jgi:hypothetical protein